MKDIKTTNKFRLFNTKPRAPSKKMIVETISKIFKEKENM